MKVRKRSQEALLGIILVVVLLTSGCAGSLRKTEMRAPREYEVREEIPLEKLRVYEIRVPVVLLLHDGTEVYGYPLDVAPSDYVLLSTTWSGEVVKTIHVDWYTIKRVYKIEAPYDPEILLTAISAPLFAPVAMFGTAIIAFSIFAALSGG